MSLWKYVSIFYKLFFNYLGLSHKYPTILITGEVALALHCAIVLAFGFIQNDSHPFPGGKKCGTNVGHCAALPLPNHFHQGAHFDGTPSSVRAHPAAATARVLTVKKQTKNLQELEAPRGESIHYNVMNIM